MKAFDIAKIIDPHAFLPAPDTEEGWVEEIVRQSQELALSKANRILSALAQSGRSSAEPVADGMALNIALDFADNPRPYHTLQAPADTNGELYEALRVLAQAYRAALSPPVGPQEAVAVTDEMVRKASNEYLMHKGERPWRVLRGGQELWETCALAMRAALVAAISPSGIDLGGEVERLTRERADFAIDANFQALRKIEAIEGEADVRRALEAAEARLATVEKALTPFASIGEMIAEHGVASDDQRVEESVYTVALDQVMKLTLGDFRRAREALASLSTNAVREGDDG
jgi:hypothetical protein